MATPNVILTIQQVDRKNKKAIVATTVEQVLSQGAAKFEVEKFTKIIIERSGAEVDDDEVVQCMKDKEVLTLLEDGQDWSPETTKYTGGPEDDVVPRRQDEEVTILPENNERVEQEVDLETKDLGTPEIKTTEHVESKSLIAFLSASGDFLIGYYYKNGSNIRVVCWDRGNHKMYKTTVHGDFVLMFPRKNTHKPLTDSFDEGDFPFHLSEEEKERLKGQLRKRKREAINQTTRELDELKLY